LTANIATPQETHRMKCAFSTGLAEHGDVRRCEHGEIFCYDHDELSWWRVRKPNRFSLPSTRRRYERAVAALAAAEKERLVP
jgi:hypothetical protein